MNTQTPHPAIPQAAFRILEVPAGMRASGGRAASATFQSRFLVERNGRPEKTCASRVQAEHYIASQKAAAAR